MKVKELVEILQQWDKAQYRLEKIEDDLENDPPENKQELKALQIEQGELKAKITKLENTRIR